MSILRRIELAFYASEFRYYFSEDAPWLLTKGGCIASSRKKWLRPTASLISVVNCIPSIDRSKIDNSCLGSIRYPLSLQGLQMRPRHANLRLSQGRISDGYKQLYFSE